MRHDADEVSFADRRNFFHFGDTADVGQRGADVVETVTFNQLIEVPTIAPLLAGSYRDICFLPENGKIFVERFGADRVFHEKWGERLNEIARTDSIAEIESLMEVDG